jgi:hypothetical protein
MQFCVKIFRKDSSNLFKNGPTNLSLTLKKPQETDKTNNKIFITPPMNRINIRFKTDCTFLKGVPVRSQLVKCNRAIFCNAATRSYLCLK